MIQRTRHIGRTLELAQERQTLTLEGGYSDAPGDHGGPTNFGITQASWSSFLTLISNATGLPQNVRDITRPHAVAFYGWWWELPQLSLDAFDDAGVQFMIFDASVLSGRGTAVQWAQTVAGVRADGWVGPITAASVNAMEPAVFIGEYDDATVRHYDAIVSHDPSQKKWQQGWHNRAHARAAFARTLSQQEI